MKDKQNLGHKSPSKIFTLKLLPSLIDTALVPKTFVHGKQEEPASGKDVAPRKRMGCF